MIKHKDGDIIQNDKGNIYKVIKKGNKFYLDNGVNDDIEFWEIATYKILYTNDKKEEINLRDYLN